MYAIGVSLRFVFAFGPRRAACLSLIALLATGFTARAGNAAGTLPGQFSVSAAGAATYKIPIYVVPGANNLQPSLALLYNSRKGRGIAGYGWSLQGLSAISRCAATKATYGSVKAVDPFDDSDASTSDKFCLDGQALIASIGAYGADGTTYHTEIATFQRVTSHGARRTYGYGPDYFEVHDWWAAPFRSFT